jgi:hypothetical protein
MHPNIGVIESGDPKSCLRVIPYCDGIKHQKTKDIHGIISVFKNFVLSERSLLVRAESPERDSAMFLDNFIEFSLEESA